MKCFPYLKDTEHIRLIPGGTPLYFFLYLVVRITYQTTTKVDFYATLIFLRTLKVEFLRIGFGLGRV